MSLSLLRLLPSVAEVCALLCPYLPLQEWPQLSQKQLKEWECGMFSRWDGQGHELTPTTDPPLFQYYEVGCFFSFARTCRAVYESVLCCRSKLQSEADGALNVLQAVWSCQHVARGQQLRSVERLWRHSEWRLVLYNGHALWNDYLDMTVTGEQGMLVSRFTPRTQAIWRRLLGDARYAEMVEPYVSAEDVSVVEGGFEAEVSVYEQFTADYVCDELFGSWCERQCAAMRSSASVSTPAQASDAAEDGTGADERWRPKRIATLTKCRSLFGPVEADWSYVLSLPSLPHLSSLHLIIDISVGADQKRGNSDGVMYTPFSHLYSLVPNLRCLHLTELAEWPEEDWGCYDTSKCDVQLVLRSLPRLRVLRVTLAPLAPATLLPLVLDPCHRIQRFELDSMRSDYGDGMSFSFPLQLQPTWSSQLSTSTQWSREEEDRESDEQAITATTTQLRAALCAFLLAHIDRVLKEDEELGEGVQPELNTWAQRLSDWEAQQHLVQQPNELEDAIEGDCKDEQERRQHTEGENNNGGSSGSADSEQRHIGHKHKHVNSGDGQNTAARKKSSNGKSEKAVS